MFETQTRAFARRNLSLKIAGMCAINAFWILLFASPISWFLKLSGVALTIWLESMYATALQAIVRLFETTQITARVDDLTHRNLLRAIKEGRADDWKHATETAKREALEEMMQSREDDLLRDQLSIPPGWLYWPSKLIFVSFVFLLNVAVCAIVGEFLATKFR